MRAKASTPPAPPPIETGDDEAALAIEAELTERALSRQRLATFTARCTPKFLEGWHIREICAAVEQIEQQIQSGSGTSARLIVEAPPRHGKSQVISRCTPLWYLGRHPEQEIIVATYAQPLADDLGRWAKQAIQSPEVASVFPKLQLRTDSRAANRLDTVAGGGIRYVGARGPICGRGAHIAIVDDPIKGAEEADSALLSEELWLWFNTTLRTRLAPGGGIIVLHTRWRVNDLIGRLLEAQKAGEGEAYKRITFPALARVDDPWGRKELEPLHAARYNTADLLALRKSLLPRDWMALYQQSPMLEEGNIFKTTDFNLYKPGTEPKNMYNFLACDLGASAKKSSNPSVVWPFGLDKDGVIWFSPDFHHGRTDILQNTTQIVDRAERCKAHAVILEGGQIWCSIEPGLKAMMRKRRVYFNIHNPPPIADKYNRSRPAHAMMAQGMVRFPDTRYVREVVIPQFLMFTGINDVEDDLIDAISWAGLSIGDLVLPSGETEADEDESEEIVKGSYADMLRRCPIPEPKNTNSHSPPRLLGTDRREKGTRYRYA